MKNILIIVAILSLFVGCEDSKKRTTEIKETILKKELISNSNTKKKELKPKIKLTNENAVSFLTEFGVENPENNIRVITPYGNIDIELFKDTPIHRANIIYLVKQKYFNNTFLHRVVPNFIIQAGSSDLKSTFKKRASIGNHYRLPYEKGNSRIHTYGSISGAKEYRKNPDKMTSPFEFFIYLGSTTSNKHLNGNYTVFGKVTKGMDIVEILSDLPADEQDWPLNNIYISVEILDQ